MAAPPERTIQDLNGVWTMNKSLSDDYDRILQMQGVSWFLRKAISYATITLTINQYVDDTAEKYTHIDIAQVATGGVGATQEKRLLDFTWREHQDRIFGKVKGKSRWIKLADIDEDDFLKTGYDDMEGEHVQALAESLDNGWTADQVWGFEQVDGKRHHVRHVIVRKGDDWKQARLVYDYRGPLEKKSDDDDDLAYGE
ncbi:hypothetical protein HO173_001786 [Letharia columbiana]|uniref:Lccl domain-containing protein n=1 Tax=Letharia columbiana TaxID=112416 RepID=A0A8H6L976_9LECA|nr:uncharacterized protein HO173_001786 [Letharia columbiana]KAF6240176.1 hypothetical protein HO173_001786 [Letharia columbiana]